MRWITYAPHRLIAIRSMPGVYVVYDELGVVYVGQSQNVRRRLMRGHGVVGVNLQVRTRWSEVRLAKIKVRYDRRFGEGLMREARLIRRLKPSGNTMHIPNKRDCRRWEDRNWAKMVPEAFERTDID